MKSAAAFGAALALNAGTPATALDNTLGRTPGLGWNSDYCMNCKGPMESTATASALEASLLGGFQNEEFIMHMADTLHSMPLPASGGKTLQELGYKYLNMDASWDTKTRTSSGDLEPDPKLWPHGMNTTIAYVHSKGLGFGLYGDKGTKDCAGNPGQLGHEVQDAKFLAANQVDWWKEDSCSSGGSQQQQVDAYAKMRDALNATGRPIWFALCGWNPWYADPALGGGNKVGNSWRVGPDTIGGWSSVLTNVNDGLATAQWYGVSVGPTPNGGGWNDGSLLLLPGMSKMSYQQHRSQFNLWCLLGMNLLLTGNLSSVDPYALETWGNERVIAVQQDSLGFPAIRLDQPAVDKVEGYTQARTAECGGEPDLQEWALDSPVAQFFHNNKSNLCINVAGCAEKTGAHVIYDGCSYSPPKGGCCDSWCNERWELNDGHLKSFLPADKDAPDGWCAVTDSATGLMTMAACSDTVDKWTYNNKTLQLKDGQGKCLTAKGTGPSPSKNMTELILGRPLAGGNFSLLLLNNRPNGTTAADDIVTCDQACLQRLKANATATLQKAAFFGHQVAVDALASFEWATATTGDDTLKFDVFDLWNNGAKVASGNTSISAVLARGGASAVFTLSLSQAN